MNHQYNQFSLHYYFHNDSHEIEAIFRNECEKELLMLFQEISHDLDLKIRIGAGPPQEGGFIEIWKFINENDEILSLFVGVLSLILTAYPVKNKKLDELQIENLEMDNLLKKEELRKLGIRYVKEPDDKKLHEIILYLLKNYRIAWRRSNFFKKVTRNRRVKKIGFRRLKDYVSLEEEKQLRVGDYEQFILFNEEIPDIKNIESSLDLISSVLKNGDFKWKAFLDGKIIPFAMKDERFKRMVFDGLIEHNNKVRLNVILNHSRKIDDTGQIKISEYYVTKVTSYFIGNEEHILN